MSSLESFRKRGIGLYMVRKPPVSTAFSLVFESLMGYKPSEGVHYKLYSTRRRKGALLTLKIRLQGIPLNQSQHYTIIEEMERIGHQWEFSTYHPALRYTPPGWMIAFKQLGGK